MLYGWKENSMLTNCLAACAHLTITVSEIERDIGGKSSFFIPPLHSMPLLGGFPSEQCHPVWYGKTRMAWLPDGEKISKISKIVVLAQFTNVTDGQTDRWTPHASNSHAMHSIARQKCVFLERVKTVQKICSRIFKGTKTVGEACVYCWI